MRPPIRARRCRARTTCVADDPRGPWEVAPGPFLDGDPAVNRYAARIVETDDGLKLLGFLHNPGGGAFVGEITDPGAGDHRRRTAG